jgi:hypothetical protein
MYSKADRLLMVLAKRIRIVGWLQILLNAVTIGFAVVAASKLIPLFLAIGLVVFAIPGFIAGVGLIKSRPWSRLAAIVMSVLNLSTLPLGPFIGVYSIIVLLDRRTERILSGTVRTMN